MIAVQFFGLFFQKPPTAKLFLPFKFDGRPDRKRPKFTGRQRPIKIDGYTILQIPKIREEIRGRLGEGLKRSYRGAHPRGNPPGR
jgi:hypothetical protein